MDWSKMDQSELPRGATVESSFAVPSLENQNRDNGREQLLSVLSNPGTATFEHMKFDLRGWKQTDEIAKLFPPYLRTNKFIKTALLELIRFPDFDRKVCFELFMECLRAVDANPRLPLSEVTLQMGLDQLVDLFYGRVQIDELLSLIQGKLYLDCLYDPRDPAAMKKYYPGISAFLASLQSLKKLELCFSHDADFQNQLFRCLEQRKMPNLLELTTSIRSVFRYGPNTFGSFLKSTEACRLENLILKFEMYGNVTEDNIMRPWIEGLPTNNSIRKIGIHFSGSPTCQLVGRLVKIFLSGTEEFDLRLTDYDVLDPEYVGVSRQARAEVWPLLQDKRLSLTSLSISDIFAVGGPNELVPANQLRDFLRNAANLKQFRMDIEMPFYGKVHSYDLYPRYKVIADGISQNTTLHNIAFRFTFQSDAQCQDVLLNSVVNSPATATVFSVNMYSPGLLEILHRDAFSLVDLEVSCQNSNEVSSLIEAATCCGTLKKLKVSSRHIDDSTWHSIAIDWLPILKVDCLVVEGPPAQTAPTMISLELVRGVQSNQVLEDASFLFGRQSFEQRNDFVSNVAKACFRNKVGKLCHMMLQEGAGNNCLNGNGGGNNGLVRSLGLVHSTLLGIDRVCHMMNFPGEDCISLQASVLYVAMKLQVAYGKEESWCFDNRC